VEIRSNLTGGRIARVLLCVERGRMVLLHGLYQEDPKDAHEGDRPGGEPHERSWLIMDERHLGSTFEDFLREEGRLEETTNRAIKQVLARQLRQLMDEQGLSKSEMARRMRTSRPGLERLLDPDNDAVTLNTLQKAARAVGREVGLELV
jgi:antitoxin HicB